MRILNRVRVARYAAGSRPQAQAGYALLMAMSIGALMIVAAAVAIPNLITEDRREREAVMIWRGKQYARAIGLFYRKTGRFPHDLEELEKGVGDVHFLRKAYNDPMNKEDGSWRLIYLGPGGQLIGSLCWQSMAQYQAAVMGMPQQVMGNAGAAPGNPGSSGSAFGQTASGETNSGAAPAGSTPASGAAAMAPAATCGSTLTPTTQQSSGFSSSPQSGASSSVPQPGAPNGPEQPTGFGSSNQSGGFVSSRLEPQIIEEGQMVGGNLIGVASKVKQKSLKTYLGGTTYRQWEFIWNPLQGQRNGAVAPATSPANGQQPNGPNSPFGPPEPPGAAIPPGPGSPSSNSPPSPGPG